MYYNAIHCKQFDDRKTKTMRIKQQPKQLLFLSAKLQKKWQQQQQQLQSSVLLSVRRRRCSCSNNLHHDYKNITTINTNSNIMMMKYYFSTNRTSPTVTTRATMYNCNNRKQQQQRQKLRFSTFDDGTNNTITNNISSLSSSLSTTTIDDIDENSINVDDIDEIEQQEQKQPNDLLNYTTTSTTQQQQQQQQHRPKATSRIEFDNDNNYYNEYVSNMMMMEGDIKNDEDDDDYDNDDTNNNNEHQHQHQHQDVPSLAINTMGAVAAIARGTYSSATPYMYGNLTDSTTTTTTSTFQHLQPQDRQQQQYGNQYGMTNTTDQQQERKKYNVYDLDAAMIREITNIDDLTDIVTQVENMPIIDGNDVEPLITPLSRMTSMKRYGITGAKLTERLLLTCIGRLPITIYDRYTTKTTYIESTIPNNKFSTVLDTREWLPTTANNNNIDDPNTDTTISSITTTNRMTSTNDTTNPLSTGMAITQPIRIRSRLSYPSANLYNRAIIAWGNLETSAGLIRAESLFQLQVEEYTRELEFVRYHQMKIRQQEMKQKQQQGTTDVSNSDLQLPPEPFAPPPGRKAYKSLIRAWSVSGEKNAPAKAYELLREMEHLSGIQELLQEPRDTNLRPLPPIPPIEMPDIGTYNVVLSVYAKSTQLSQAPVMDRVKKIVQRLRDLQVATQNDEYQLDSYTYIALLQTYQKYIASSQPTIDYAILDELYKIFREIHNEIERRKYLPQDYHDRMHARKRSMDDNKVPQKRQRDLSIFFPMSMSWAYGVLVEALLKSQPLYKTIFIADDIVTAMTGRKNRINAPIGDMSTNINAASASPVPIHIPYEICTQVWPQFTTLMQVVEGWSRSGLPQTNDRIEQIIQCVVADAHYPRIYNLHEAMDAWCNSSWQFAPIIVENLLHRSLEKATHVHNKPTGQTFAIALTAWIKSNKPEAPHRAELLLQHLLHLYEVQEDSWYKPREIHFRYIFTNWINRCSTGETYDGMSGKDLYPAEHCEKLIYWIRNREWFRKYAENIYGMAIRAWAIQKFPSDYESDDSIINSSRKTIPNRVEHAVALLQSFAELLLTNGELIPPFPCNWVLQSCCHVERTIERKVQSYEAAIKTFQRCKHNARTYVLMVQVIRTQVPELDRPHLELIEELFRKCCVAGLVSQDLINHVVSTAMSTDTLQRLFGVSYQIAQLILQQREIYMKQQESIKGNTTHQRGGGNNTTTMLRMYDKIPSSLLVENLPQEWCRNVIKNKPPVPKKLNTTP